MLRFIELDGCVWIEGDPFMRFYRGDNEVELDGKFSLEQLRQIINEMGCQYCGKPIKDEQDHITCGITKG